MDYNLGLMKAELMDENTGFIEDLNVKNWQNLGKTWSKNSMNLVWENLELNRKKHGRRKLKHRTGQLGVKM